VTAERAEADDIILVLSRALNEKILIYSGDKDMIQAQHNNPLVSQYSHQTKKWLAPEDKYEHMEHWFLEHTCLGDASDNVFNIVYKSEFSDNFKKHLEYHGIDTKFHDVYTFKTELTDIVLKKQLISSFNIYKKQRISDPEPVLDVYKDIRFGSSTLFKTIAKFKTLDKFLDSNPIIRENYNLNCKLVLEEGIPEYVRNNIIEAYKTASTAYDKQKFDDYLDRKELSQAKYDIMKVFKVQETDSLSAENCGW